MQKKMPSSPKPPVSVLRKVGSSKCLQLDFHQQRDNIISSTGSMSNSIGIGNSMSMSNSGNAGTITLVNAEHLPSFSVLICSYNKAYRYRCMHTVTYKR
jgi:hypothetical protein